MIKFCNLVAVLLALACSVSGTNYLAALEGTIIEELDMDAFYGSVFRNKFNSATKLWLQRVRAVFSEMLGPLKQEFQAGNDRGVAYELQYFFNCDTCRELTQWLRKSP